MQLHPRSHKPTAQGDSFLQLGRRLPPFAMREVTQWAIGLVKRTRVRIDLRFSNAEDEAAFKAALEPQL